MSTNSALVGTVGKSIFASDSDLGNANAGFHNSIFRGKYLGNSYTASQRAEITAGTFNDMFIGDYWTIGGTDYVICHFDYYYNCSDSNIDYHHVVLMPRSSMNLTGYISASSLITTANAGVTVSSQESVTAFKWNATMAAPNTNSTAGGYVGSRMRTVVMPACDNKVKADFGSTYVHAVSEIYPSTFASSTDGRAAGWAWTSTDLICDLCNETMVYGQQVWGLGSTFGNMAYEVGIDKWQLAIFRLYPQFANTRSHWWLRSVTSASSAAYVNGSGNAINTGSSYAFGVRPRFLLS